MTRERLFVEELLYNAVVFMIFYGVTLLPATMFMGDNFAVVLLFTALPFAINMLIRMYVKYISLFFLLHVLIPAAGYFIASAWGFGALESALLTVVLTAYLIFSIASRIGANRPNLSFAACAVACIVYVVFCAVAEHNGLTGLIGIYVTLATVTVAAGVLEAHLVNVDSSLDSLTAESTQPVKPILSFNNKIITGFLIILLALVFGSRYMMIDRIVRALGQGFLTLIKFIFSLFTYKPEQVDDYGEIEVAQPPENVFGIEEQEEPFWLWEYVEKILVALVTVLLVVGFVALIVYVIYVIYKRFFESARMDEDEKEFIMPNLFKEMVGKQGKRIASWFLPVNRIRRVFKRKIISHIKKGVQISQSDTPTQMKDKIQSEDISGLVKEYGAARYQ
ncbi:MAG: hypothetical protein LBL96_05600 [Clostridiales bacterium]|jgi:hypothetical protein|nr:hypothetical protein [Clostridiales bacterium]